MPLHTLPLIPLQTACTAGQATAGVAGVAQPVTATPAKPAEKATAADIATTFKFIIKLPLIKVELNFLNINKLCSGSKISQLLPAYLKNSNAKKQMFLLS
jgi:hypothetical protein